MFWQERNKFFMLSDVSLWFFLFYFGFDVVHEQEYFQMDV